MAGKEKKNPAPRDVNEARTFWEDLYQVHPVEEMHWFYPALDPDLAAALEQLAIRRGRFLDLGAGPGTQAIALARCGFDVTGADVSITAVRKARVRARAAGVRVRLLHDDILFTKLQGPFDCILDRGCFHVLMPGSRPNYVQSVHRLLASSGLLFLKCFSHRQPGSAGPFRFTPEEIAAAFREGFDVVSIRDTVYHGNLDPSPKALFGILRRV